MIHHISYLVREEWERPGKQVEAVGQLKWLLNVFILFDIHLVVFDEDYRSLVLV